MSGTLWQNGDKQKNCLPVLSNIGGYKRRMLILMCSLTIFALATSAFLIGAPAYASLTPDMLATVGELTSEEYAGRLTGSGGNQLAVNYLQDAFSRLQLACPTDLEGYLQPYTQPTRLMDQPPTLKVIDSSNQAREFIYSKDYTVSVSPGSTLQAKVTATGEILSNLSSLETMDLDNKILLVPEEVIRADQVAVMTALVNLQSNLAGIILEVDFPNEYIQASSFVEDVSMPSLIPLLFSVRAPVFANLIQASKSGHLLEMSAQFLSTEVTVANVVGLIPGTSDQCIIIGAHLDGAGENGDGIYNPGALDNSSGIAVMLAVARHFSGRETKPTKSLAFVAFNGEEQGMYGSSFFVKNPPINLQQAVMINLDSVGADNGSSLQIESPPGKRVKIQSELFNLARQQGIEVKMGQSLGSDHRSFAEAGIAAINLIQPNYEVMHTPLDTVERIDPERLQEVANLLIDVIERQAY